MGHVFATVFAFHVFFSENYLEDDLYALCNRIWAQKILHRTKLTCLVTTI